MAALGEMLSFAPMSRKSPHYFSIPLALKPTLFRGIWWLRHSLRGSCSRVCYRLRLPFQISLSYTKSNGCCGAHNAGASTSTNIRDDTMLTRYPVLVWRSSQSSSVDQYRSAHHIGSELLQRQSLWRDGVLGFVPENYYSQWCGHTNACFGARRWSYVSMFLLSLNHLFTNCSGDRTGFRYWNDPGAFAEYKLGGGLGKFIGVWSTMIQAYGFS